VLDVFQKIEAEKETKGMADVVRFREEREGKLNEEEREEKAVKNEF